MDIDKLLAGFKNMAEEYEKKMPLLDVGNYVPNMSHGCEKSEAGARRFVAAFLYWLISRNHLSFERSYDLSGEINLLNAKRVLPSGILKEKFLDKISDVDIENSIHPFCHEYMASPAGGFGADYHKLFVEGTELNSFLDVEESWENLEKIALLVDERFTAFSRNDKNWDAQFQPSGEGSPVHFSSLDEWIASFRMFKDLADTPAGKYKTRVQQYWALVDAVNENPSIEVAHELVRTYLNIDDSSVQESVWRTLRSFPWPLVFSAILDNIEELIQKTEWAPTLVDIFDDNLPVGTLDEMVQKLDGAPVGNRRSYLKALEKARRSGSLHAAQILDRFYLKN